MAQATDHTGVVEKLLRFIDKLAAAAKKNNSLLCVGLDPDPGLMPVPSIATFNREIIAATQDLVCSYKPNVAFYEAMGGEGMAALHATLAAIPHDIPTIIDAKRGDIGNTSCMYARAVFDQLGADAVTVNPYLGRDSIEPFLAYADRQTFVLCRTSNPGSADFQSLPCTAPDGSTEPLFLAVARKCLEMNDRGNVGLVVGATHQDELVAVRSLCPGLPLLIPGIGAQGGDLAATVRNGTAPSAAPAIIVSSRQILYASRSRDFASAARREAESLRKAIQEHLSR